MLGYKNIERVKPAGLELTDRLVGVQRVTKVTKGGRTFGFTAIVVVGDGKGVAGYGLGKSKEVASAIAKAVEEAKKNLVRIPLNGSTIPHTKETRYGGAQVLLRPASEGTGVIAGGSVREVFESTSVKDVFLKSKCSTNQHDVVNSAIKSLLGIRNVDQVPRDRGISISKVFNG